MFKEDDKMAQPLPANKENMLKTKKVKEHFTLNCFLLDSKTQTTQSAQSAILGLE